MMNPETKEETQQISIDNQPFERYDLDDVKMMWRRFAFKINEEGKTTFYSALTRRDPILREDDTYVLEVDNQAQLDYIKPLMPDFVGYLRENIKNYGIKVLLELTKNPEDDIEHLSSKDRFKKLARKNPNLHTLKTMFNLEIEY